MLLPDQVNPFLQHPEASVRDAAARYLAHAHDHGSASADHFWQAIDRYGAKACRTLVANLDSLPLTDASITRLLDAARSEHESSYRYLYLRALCAADFAMIGHHWDAIRSAENIPSHVLAHLEDRLRLRHEPVDRLWNGLMEHAQSIAHLHCMEFDDRIAWRFVEALARHPDEVADRTMALLGDKSVIDWREVFMMDLAGAMRHRPAISLLVDKMRAEDDEIGPQRAGLALMQIGDLEAVREIGETFASESWDFRLSAVEVLEKFTHPTSEDVLLRLLPGEPDIVVRTSLAAALCQLCTTKGLEIIHELIAKDQYDPQMADLPADLLTTGQMVGYQPPEAAEWRQHVAEVEARVQEALGDSDSFMREPQERWLAGEPMFGGHQEDDDYSHPEMELQPDLRDALFDDDQPAPLDPFMWGERKVGRNDPCPCGSGKKYKKCCWRKDAAY